MAVAVSVAVIGGGGAAAYHFIGRSHAGEEPQKAVEVNQAETTDTVSSGRLNARAHRSTGTYE